MDTPRVDVLVATTGRRSLELAILSGCHQTWRNVRVVVVGDGPQRAAREVVRCMQKLYGAIEYHETEIPAGHGNAARMWWLQQPDCSPWIKFLDDDDVLNPCCIATMMTEAKEGVTLVLCQMAMTYQSGGIVRRHGMHVPDLQVGKCGTGQMLVRRDAAKNCEWPHRANGEVVFARGLEARGALRIVMQPLYWYMAYRDNKVRYKA